MEVATQLAKREKLECRICDKTFKNRQGYSNHLKSHSRKPKERILCDKCCETFRDSHALKMHVKTYHERDPKKKAVTCGLCGVKIFNQLNNHFLAAHGISVKKQYLEFFTLEDFFSWKENIEKATSSFYVKFRGTKVDKLGNKTTYYNCHRRGFFNSRGTNRRKSRVSGSNKINGYCPAMIILKETAEKFSVIYSETHVGHSTDIERLRLTKAEKRLIAEELEKNTPVSDILKQVKDSASDENFTRLHLLSRNDISNIAAEYGIKLSRNQNKSKEKSDKNNCSNEDCFTDEESVERDLLMEDKTEVLAPFIEIPTTIEVRSVVKDTDLLEASETTKDQINVNKVPSQKEKSELRVFQRGNLENTCTLGDLNPSVSRHLVVKKSQMLQQVAVEKSEFEVLEDEEDSDFDEMQTRAVEEFSKIMQMADTKEKLKLILKQIAPLQKMMSKIDQEDSSNNEESKEPLQNKLCVLYIRSTDDDEDD